MRLARTVGAGLLLAVGSCDACHDASPSSSSSDGAVPVIVVDGAAMDDLSGMLEPFRKKGDMPALGAAVWRGGTMIAIGVTGVRKLGDPTQPRP